MYDEYNVVNMRDYMKENGEESLIDILNHFSCPLNPYVERFLKENSIEFTKKNQSVTYLIFTNSDITLVGYFTLTIKPIIVKRDILSKTTQRKMFRVSEQQAEQQTFHLAAFLIAQLGKNFKNDANKKITGQQLLEIAIEKIKEAQYILGGMVVFLETEENVKLMKFYKEENHFTIYNTRERNSFNNQKLIQMLKTL